MKILSKILGENTKSNQVSLKEPVYSYDFEKMQNSITEFEKASKIACDAFENVKKIQVCNNTKIKDFSALFSDVSNDFTKVFNMDDMVLSILPKADKQKLIEDLKSSFESTIELMNMGKINLFTELRKSLKVTYDCTSALFSDKKFCFYFKNALLFFNKYKDITPIQKLSMENDINTYNSAYSSLEKNFDNVTSGFNINTLNAILNSTIKLHNKLVDLWESFDEWDKKWEGALSATFSRSKLPKAEIHDMIMQLDVAYKALKGIERIEMQKINFANEFFMYNECFNKNDKVLLHI